MTKEQTRKIETFVTALYTDTTIMAIISITLGIWGKDTYQSMIDSSLNVHYNEYTKEIEMTITVDGYKD